MFGNIIWGIIAIILWPITLTVGGLILLFALWKTFVDTKNHYKPPRDEVSGEILKSFIMGGAWTEESLPDDEKCTNAWMILLADAEDLTENASELRNQLIERAINILNLAGASEVDSFDVAKDSIVPDLIFHLRHNKRANWLQDELISRHTSFSFSLKKCLQAAEKSLGIAKLTCDWKKQADEELEKVWAEIPDYSEDEIAILAKVFATVMREDKTNLEIFIETYETASFSKALSRFEWNGETVTECGLAHLAISSSYQADNVPSGDKFKEIVSDEIWETKQANYSYEYGFIVSQTTIDHAGKDVRVVLDIDEAPAYYVWTVTEGAMDYDIYEEKREGPTKEECTRVHFSTGDWTAVFDMTTESSYARFLDGVKNHLDNYDKAIPNSVE